MDRETLEFIVRSNQAELYRYVKYLGADMAMAQDVVQDTFLAAFNNKKVPDLSDEGRRGAWLRGIARNIFLNSCRRRRRRREIADPNVLEYAEKCWTTEFLRDGDGFDYIEALRECIEKLGDRAKELVRMRYFERKPRVEMARAFQLSQEGVKAFLRRVRANLGKCISLTLKVEWEDAGAGVS